jgi:hypothetical protein
MATRALMIAIFFSPLIYAAADSSVAVSQVTVADLVCRGRILLHSAVATESTSGEAYLNLVDCGLTSLYGLKTLPGITRVQQLDIRNNKIAALTREDMACMPHLKHIYAGDNQIEHIAEDTFADNPRLIGISLSNNKLQDASAIVRVFTQLQLIDLACNKLNSFRPRVDNPALQFCNVAHNPGPYGEPDTGTMPLRCRQLRRFGDLPIFCTEEYYNMKRSR